MRSASFCGFGPLPTIASDFATLSNTNGRSSACGEPHLPPSTGVGQSSSYSQTGAPPWAALRSACVQACCRTRRSVVMAKNRSDGDAFGIRPRKPAITLGMSRSGTQPAKAEGNPASSSVNRSGRLAPIRAVVSVRVDPTIMGMVAETAGPSGAHGFRGSTIPSTTGLKLGRTPVARMALPSPSTSLSVGSFGNRCSSVGFTSTAARNANACFVASSGVRPSRCDPLCTIALWNNPRACGIAIRVLTFAAPPDWPKIVTFAGSPPKNAMLSWTQRSAVTRSSMPTLPDSAYSAPPMWPRYRKPNTFSR